MTAREGALEGRGVSIHFIDWGGDGPPLILLHATGFLAALWRPVAERLASGFRVIAVDQRGHGDSSKPADGYRFEVFADDLQQLIEGLALERPLAAGHSAGATTIVVHTKHYPGIVRRAVLIEPILPRPEWYMGPSGRPQVNPLADAARKRRAVWPSRAAVLRAYRSRDTFRTWREDVLRLYVDEGMRPRRDGQVELKCPPEIEAQVFDATRYLDPWPMLREMACPALVIWGHESHLPGSGLARQVEEAIPQVRTVLVPDASHFLPQEHPDQVGRITEEFLSDGSTEPAEASAVVP